MAEIDNGLKEIAFIAAQLRDARRLSAQAQEDALERVRARFDDPTKPTFVWQLDFAEVFHRDQNFRGDNLVPPDKSRSATSRNGFDLLIGNPPYIRIQTLKKADPKLVEYYKTRYVAASKGNYDLYVVFVERSLELLNAKGQLAFILPHKFFNSQYGEPLRGLLAVGKHLRHVIHFGDQQIFPGATNYVCLLFLAKSGAHEMSFVRVDNVKMWMSCEQGIGANIAAKDITESEWNFVVGKGADLFERLQSMPTKLENVTSRIFQGLKTGADKIYIFDEVAKARDGYRIKCRQTETDYLLEAELLRPLIKGGDSHAFRLTHPDRMILFPYDRVDDGSAKLIPAARLRKDYPHTWQYFNAHKEVLGNRDGGEMAGESWYGYSRVQALDLMPLAKLFTPDIAPVAGFSYDEAGEVFFTGGVAGGYGILASPPITPQFLLGVLNSHTSDYFHHRIATRMRGGWFSYESRFIRNIPIPESDEAQRLTVERLVDHLLWLHRQPSVAQPDRNHPQDPLIASYLHQTVNALVYELFFPQEVHAANLNLFEVTEGSAVLTNPPAIVAARLDWYRDQFKKLSAPGHPLRIALDKLQTLDLVRIIEGQA